MCGGPLHRADYLRKPRGEPAGLPPDFAIRFSLCCGSEGCRRRAPPPSVRFLGRRVYLGLVVVLVGALRQGPTPRRMRAIRSVLDVSRRTVERWQRWWRDEFPRSALWRGERGRTPHPDEPLPRRLVLAYAAAGDDSGRVALLRLISDLPCKRTVTVDEGGRHPRRR